MIKNNMPLVGFVTSRFIGRGYEYEDLYSYGCIGLIKAVDRFDPGYGVAFSTYAVPLIIGEIKRFLRGDGAVHVSRTIRENALKLMKAMNDSEGASLETVCDRTGLDRQEALIALNAMSPVRSIYEPISGDGALILQDTLGKDDGDRMNDSIALAQAMEKLDDSERELIVRRYFKRHTQTSIAADMGMTQVQISRMEKKILQKLRSAFI